MTKRTVIYHASCVDGYTAAWVVWKKFGDEDTVYIPAAYGEAPIDPEQVRGQDVLFVDFAYAPEAIEALAKTAKYVTVVDHHKTHAAALQERFPDGDSNVFIIMDMKKSGAGLAWDCFHYDDQPRPWIVNYVEDRDLWKFELDRSKQVNAWLGAQLRDSFTSWSKLAAMSVSESALLGTAVEMAVNRYVADMAKEARRIKFHGHEVPIVNAPYVNASELIGHLAQTATFAIGWFQRGDGLYQYSLRSRNDFDVSEIAKQYGGGGHKNAAGFQLKTRIPEDT